MIADQSSDRQSGRFLFLYALAVAGGAIAYVPFLTIILPVRVTELAGSADVHWVAYAAFAGAVMASIANIAFGWLSDITYNRRIWVWGGLIASSGILVNFPHVQTQAALLLFVMLWQFSLNMMLGPLAAWAGDCVPDHQKGMLGGLLAFAPAMGAISGVIATYPNLAGFEGRLWIVAAMVALCVLPLLLIGKPERFVELQPESRQASEPADAAATDTNSKRQLAVRMWISRLLLQICEAALFANVLFWFRNVSSRLGDDDTAQILSGVVIAAVPVAMVIGRWADRHNKPIAPLAICASFASLGLALMAVSSTAIAAIASYAIFGVAASAFLSLHTSQTLRVLPQPRHRGRDLGIFNLTNTTPSLAMPWLVVWLVPVFGFPALLAALSLFACLAAILLWRMRSPVMA